MGRPWALLAIALVCVQLGAAQQTGSWSITLGADGAEAYTLNNVAPATVPLFRLSGMDETLSFDQMLTGLGAGGAGVTILMDTIIGNITAADLDTIEAIGYDCCLYRATLVAHPPWVLYFTSNGTTPYVTTCGPVLRGDTAAFRCAPNGGPSAGMVSQVGPVSTVSASTVTVPLTVADGSFSGGQLLGVGVAKGADMLMFMRSSSDISAANSFRANLARIAVGFLYFFVCVAMLLVAFNAGVLQAWCLPVVGRAPIVLWTIVFFIVMTVCSWAAGLAGWIAALSFFGLYLIVVYFVYWIAHRTARREKKTTDSSKQPGCCLQVFGNKTQYKRRPEPMFSHQHWMLIVSGLVTVAIVGFCLIVFYCWKNPDYLVYDRGAQEVVVEIQPSLVAKAISVIYAFENMATIWRFDWLLKTQTKACGPHYTETFSTDAERYEHIQQGFIDEYSIDMSIYERPSYTQYNTVNDWFTRKLRAGVRPIAGMDDPKVIVSSADCRVTVFPDVGKDFSVWLKDSEFTVESLLANSDASAAFKDGASMAILRLAPADYHRTHSPVNATVTKQYMLESTIYSVGADAMRSDNGAIYNSRSVSLLTTTATATPQTMAYVAIGATCVGSVVMEKKEGESVGKGEDFSYFQFGGSTVVWVFPKGSVTFDADLVAATNDATEAYVQMGTQLARWN